MNRVGVFVDAGYLFAAGGRLLAGRAVRRGELRLNVPAVSEALEKLATDTSGLPLLRIYWYDGTDSGPSRQHTDLACSAEIKVRLGIVNSHGEQKGVDSLLVTDMINLARHGAMATALLVTGDEDIRVGVQQAQEHGVRVHLLGISPARGNQSNLLLQEADVTHEWGTDAVGRFLEHALPSGPVEVHVPAGAPEEEVVGLVVDAVIEQLSDDVRRELRRSFESGEWRIPGEHDRDLLRALGSHCESMTAHLKSHARRLFRERV